MKNKYLVLSNVQKRDGSIVPFDSKHIFRAIMRAMDASFEGDELGAKKVMFKVLDELMSLKKSSREKRFIPDVEKIQDLIENELISNNFAQTAKAFILYRKERATFEKRLALYQKK